MIHGIHRAHVGRLLVGFCVGVTGTLCSLPVAAGLYECRTESGALMYTDSPAQFARCQPVASGGTSRLGLVGGPHPPASLPPAAAAPDTNAASPVLPIPTQMQPATGPSLGAPSDGLVSTGASPVGVAGGASEGPPCIPGINPLNPYSAPPCDMPPQAGPQPSSPPLLVPIPAQP